MPRMPGRMLCPWLVLTLLACGSEPTQPDRAAPKPSPKSASPADDLACLQIVFFQHNGGTPCADCVETLPADAERKAHEAQARLAQGADFTELARTLASAPLGNDGDGVLGTFRRSQWPETMTALREPVFALKVGEHAKQPLQIDFAYVLLRRCATGAPEDTVQNTRE